MKLILKILFSVLFWGGLLGASAWFQIKHGNYFGALSDAALLAGLGYVVFIAIRDRDKPKPVQTHTVVYNVGTLKKRRPWATYILIGLCCAATLIAWISDKRILMQLGAAGYTPIVVHHEWWRLISAMFLHVNYMHIWMNMTALYWLGMELEGMLGRPRFLALYFLAGIGGGVGVVLMHQENTIGASTALYGLMGASAFYAYSAWHHGFKTYAKSLLVGIGIALGVNLLITFGIPTISAAGHLGGLFTGLLVAFAFGIPPAMKSAWRLNECAPSGVRYTCEANGSIVYQGPAQYALSHGLVSPDDSTTSEAHNGLADLPVKYCDFEGVALRCIVRPELIESLLVPQYESAADAPFQARAGRT